MSKVVHLSDEAHAKAKDFCKKHSLRMSDWVAGLIENAISQGQVDTSKAPVAKKKPLQRIEEGGGKVEEDQPAYAAPPFWARAQN